MLLTSVQPACPPNAASTAPLIFLVRLTRAARVKNRTDANFTQSRAERCFWDASDHGETCGVWYIDYNGLVLLALAHAPRCTCNAARMRLVGFGSCFKLLLLLNFPMCGPQCIPHCSTWRPLCLPDKKLQRGCLFWEVKGSQQCCACWAQEKWGRVQGLIQNKSGAAAKTQVFPFIWGGYCILVVAVQAAGYAKKKKKM